MAEFVVWVQAWWPVIVTVLLPFVVAAIARSTWTKDQKGWLATALAAIVGVLAVVASDIAYTPENVVLIVAAVRGGMQIAYDLFRRAGITSAWLDSLLSVGSDVVPVEEEPAG